MTKHRRGKKPRDRWISLGLPLIDLILSVISSRERSRAGEAQQFPLAVPWKESGRGVSRSEEHVSQSNEDSGTGCSGPAIPRPSFHLILQRRRPLKLTFPNTGPGSAPGEGAFPFYAYVSQRVVKIPRQDCTALLSALGLLCSPSGCRPAIAGM